MTKSQKIEAGADKIEMVRLWLECVRTKIGGGGDVPAATIEKSLKALETMLGEK